MTPGFDVPMSIVIAAGGTGGHVYPAVALAREFQRQQEEVMITFVGSGKKLESTILAHEGFTVAHIDVKGMVGRGAWGGMQSVLLLPKAIWQSMKILRARSANLVIGTGGYFSPPVVFAAALLGMRRIIMEPNAIPGLANRVLGPIADRVFLAFESAKSYFNESKVRIVGTPVREEFFREMEPTESPAQNTLLIFGGSQGAKAINTAVLEALQVSPVLRHTCSIIHQTGEADHERVRKTYEAAGIQAQVVPFLFDMPRVLKSADLVISRSGAGTLAELAVCGKASILIPYPHATHGHQEKNARSVEASGAASVLLESDLTGESLAHRIEMFLNNPDQLRKMGELSLAGRNVDATQRMIQECQLLLNTAS
ncbi:MAG: undecaprenyldiphospho-muramoylpentapeptide beta-N-acetylglucosaminyltransferase [Nitrospirales bacterium]